jgi:hypothetical protein
MIDVSDSFPTRYDFQPWRTAPFAEVGHLLVTFQNNALRQACMYAAGMWVNVNLPAVKPDP